MQNAKEIRMMNNLYSGKTEKQFVHSMNPLELNGLNVSIISCVYAFIFTLPKGEIVNIRFFVLVFIFELCAHLVWNGKTVTISQPWMHNKPKTKKIYSLFDLWILFSQSAIANRQLYNHFEYNSNVKILRESQTLNTEHWTLNIEQYNNNKMWSKMVKANETILFFKHKLNLRCTFIVVLSLGSVSAFARVYSTYYLW